jgi:phage FluMu gp28-like protein
MRIDEVAFIARSMEVYGAADAVIGSNKRYRMILTSTPLVEDGLFYWACTEAEGWSRHVTNIHDAVADGLPRDIEDLRRNSLAWEREYLCMWGQGGLYFNKDFLLNAFRETVPTPPQGVAPYGITLGVDLAKIQDNTEIVAVLRSPVPHVIGHWVMRSLNYRDQRKIIADIANELQADTVVVDETKHPGTTDELRRDLGDARVWGRVITNKWKNRAFPRFRKALELERITADYDVTKQWQDGRWVAVRSRPLLSQLLKVEQSVTKGGSITYDVRREDGQGHGDGVSALLLAHDAILHADTEHPVIRAQRIRKMIAAKKKASPRRSSRSKVIF